MNKSIVVVEASMSGFKKIKINNYEIVYYTQKLESKNINEDGLAIIKIPNGVVLAVADGVGGSVESYRAVEHVLTGLENFFKDFYKDFSIISDPEVFEDPENLKSLEQSDKLDDYLDLDLNTEIIAKLQQINNQILELAETPQTTLTMAVIIKNNIFFYQIGDSGALLSDHDKDVKFKTPFQSVVGELLNNKQITEEEALIHPLLNIVNNVFGHKDFYIADYVGWKITKYDSLLLASDGVLDNYLSKELVSIFQLGDLVTIAQNLVKAIQQERNLINNQEFLKKDDISFLICRYYKTLIPS
jgi:serine/threonine protein phosphatase PrpC